SASTSSGSNGNGSQAASGATLPAADPSLSAFRLLDNAGYTAALGEPVVAIEDDGDVPDPNGGHRSVTRVATQSGTIFRVTLHSTADETVAKSEFQQVSGSSDPSSSSSSVAGAGDEAAFTGGKTVVRKGAQVLTIEVDLAGTAQGELDQIKINGGDPTQALNAFEAKTQTLAAPLAAKLSGKTAPDQVVGLPDGAIDPCLPGADAVGAIKRIYGVSSVQTTYVQGESPPAIGCEFQVTGLQTPIEIDTVTDAQLTAAVSPTTSADLFQQDVQGSHPAAADANVQVSPLGEFNEALHTDPFGWIIEINFPERSRQQCPSPDEIAKGEEFIDEMLKAIGDLKNRVPESTQLQQLADKYQQLADDYKAQADKARAAESAGSCK
ncbi:MAG TPA: hypothetical protein VGJ03_09125, partial [Acidimicrobiales bacterium]